MIRRLLSLALLLGCAVAASGAPPTIDIPPEIHPSGQYVQFIPKTDAVSVEYVGLDGIEPFPSAFLKDGRAFVLDANSLAKDKPYRFVAVAAGKTGETARTKFVVVNGKVPSPGDPDNPPPPPPPPPPANDKFYLLIIRADGPAAPSFTKSMAMPEWNTLRAAGHAVKDVTLSEATAAKLSAGVSPDQLPTVLTLVVRPDGKSSQLVRGPVSFPTVGSGVLDLPKGVRP